MSGEVAALFDLAIAEARATHPERAALVGVGGAQGSGKSHQCRAYAAARPRVAHFSLDDVYLTRAEREAMALDLHPLFATRGPPGTHDLDLADETIAALARAGPDTRTALPRFDKRRDERAPRQDWPLFAGRPEAILIDGWCMAALPPGAGAPLNEVERQDTDVSWRSAVADALAGDYADFFAAFDALIYLQAPSWEIVRAWRCQQEEQTLGRPLTHEERAALDRFVMHYERITRAMLAGHHTARWVVHLDEARHVLRVEER